MSDRWRGFGAACLTIGSVALLVIGLVDPGNEPATNLNLVSGGALAMTGLFVAGVLLFGKKGKS